MSLDVCHTKANDCGSCTARFNTLVFVGLSCHQVWGKIFQKVHSLFFLEEVSRAVLIDEVYFIAQQLSEKEMAIPPKAGIFK